VLKKLEQQINGIIRRSDFMEPMVPIRYRDADTSEKITNGMAKSMHSFMTKLIPQKNDFVEVGKKFPNSSANKKELKKNTGIANFFISFHSLVSIYERPLTLIIYQLWKIKKTYQGHLMKKV
jgi:hypothetical protein